MSDTTSSRESVLALYAGELGSFVKVSVTVKI